VSTIIDQVPATIGRVLGTVDMRRGEIAEKYHTYLTLYRAEPLYRAEVA
jgi:hypothetical protein